MLDHDFPASGRMGELVRRFDWAATSLVPAGAWPQSLRTTVGLLLASPVPMVLLWGAEGVMIYNDAYADFAGERHPRLLGSPVLDGWPEVAAFNRRVMDVGMRGETLSFHDQHLVLHRNGTPEDVWLDLNYSPVADESGRPAGVLAIVVETTQRVLAERHRRQAEVLLRAGEERLALAIEAGRLGSWELDLASCELTASPQCKLNFGRDPAALFPYAELEAAIHPDDVEHQRRAVAEALANGSELDVEYRAVLPGGEVRWLQIRGRASYGPAGVPSHLAGISIDVTQRRLAEETLREETHTLETLNRIGSALAGDLDLESVVQTVTDAATELSDARFGAFFYNVQDERGESYMLYSLSGVPREVFAGFPMPRNTAVFGPTFRGEGIIRVDDIRQDPRYGLNTPHAGMPKGHLPVVSYLAVPVVSRTGEVLGGLFFGHEQPGMFTARAERIVGGIAAQAAIAIDNARLYRDAQAEIAERRRVEARQRLLLHELNHRVKNTLAVVQGIAGLTLTGERSLAEARSAFTRRVGALATAHGLLTDSEWQGASLRTLVAGELAPYDKQAMVVGEDITLGPRAASTLSLVLHELATNAAKHGALSVPEGHLEVSWRVTGEGPGSLLFLWREDGGPPVRAPKRHGFGRRLVEAIAAHDLDGHARLEFPAEGVAYTLEAPLAALTAAA